MFGETLMLVFLCILCVPESFAALLKIFIYIKSNNIGSNKSLFIEGPCYTFLSTLLFSY